METDLLESEVMAIEFGDRAYRLALDAAVKPVVEEKQARDKRLVAAVAERVGIPAEFVLIDPQKHTVRDARVTVVGDPPAEAASQDAAEPAPEPTPTAARGPKPKPRAKPAVEDPGEGGRA